MASRLATSSLRCLQNSAMRNLSLRRGVRSSIYVSRTESQSARRKVEATLDPLSPFDRLPLYRRSHSLPRFDWPPDLALCVYEIKHTSSSLQLSKPKPETETVVYYHNHVLCTYLLKEDGTFSPKYSTCPPSFLNDYSFTGATFNGLLHFHNPKSSSHALWNPTTSEYKILPNPKPHPKTLEEWRLKAFGMWCDHKFEDIKVLQINILNLAREVQCCFDQFNLYSLKTNSWRLIPVCTQFCYDLFVCACISGVVYCKAHGKNNDVTVIRSFDLSTETMSTLPFPKHDGNPYKLFECNGLLSVVALLYDEDGVPCQFHLWTMRDGSWIMESVFHTRGVREMLWLSLDGKLLYFVSMTDELMVFDRSIGKLKHLGVNCFGYNPNIIPFVESFGQLNGISHVEETLEERLPKDQDIDCTE
ncbi:putative F-box protein At3g10240 [Salvia hispanica]|uniref:putative F-box protein At3g10240 n=1 Tax=Salvia hispanica TaxID=49212 RepID=UPI0020091CE7|nr:putative F-box protein At3g10240 [Salvia hispanica]XP_047963151.1 putative F-box protein At3g10240 [Salvia hispanica]